MTGYDYIIVGAGSAGCTLAGRLTEDADKRVLVIEAGGKDNDWLIKIPIEHRLILRGKCGAQKGGSRSERIESAEQLYTVRKLPSQLLGKSVLLMDDVRTSGATTDTISRLLVEAGISNVRIWTLSGTARAPKELGN